jgi:hypothetical protein
MKAYIEYKLYPEESERDQLTMALHLHSIIEILSEFKRFIDGELDHKNWCSCQYKCLEDVQTKFHELINECPVKDFLIL